MLNEPHARGEDAFINIKYMIPTYQSFGSRAFASPCPAPVGNTACICLICLLLSARSISEIPEVYSVAAFAKNDWLLEGQPTKNARS